MQDEEMTGAEMVVRALKDEGVEHLLTVLAEPEWRLSVGRGRRLSARDAADAAIEWLERAYPTSASISV